MANEIQINATMAASKNNSSIGGGGVFNYTMAGNFTNKLNLNISHTAWTQITFGGSIPTTSPAPTAFYVKNLDGVNPITVAVDNAGTNKFTVVPAGGTVVIIPPTNVQYWAEATTADVTVEVGVAQ